MAFKSNEVIIWGCSLSLCVTAGDWLLCTHVLAYTLFVPNAYLYHVAYLICIPPAQRHSCLRLGNHCRLRAPPLSHCCRYKKPIRRREFLGTVQQDGSRTPAMGRSWSWKSGHQSISHPYCSTVCGTAGKFISLASFSHL